VAEVQVLSIARPMPTTCPSASATSASIRACGAAVCHMCRVPSAVITWYGITSRRSRAKASASSAAARRTRMDILKVYHVNNVTFVRMKAAAPTGA
jgi:hypothetical protein